MTDLCDEVWAVIERHMERVQEYARHKNVPEAIEKNRDDPLLGRFHLHKSPFVVAKLGAGLMTSIHRKLGDSVEEATQVVLSTTLGVAMETMRYRATITVDDEVEERELDGYVRRKDLAANKAALSRFDDVIQHHGDAVKRIGQDVNEVEAVAYEVRHCYQSADSKRANADIAMAAHLRSKGIMPVMLVFCSTSNPGVISRYRNHWVVLEGDEANRHLAALTGFDLFACLDSKEHRMEAMMGRILTDIGSAEDDEQR